MKKLVIKTALLVIVYLVSLSPAVAQSKIDVKHIALDLQFNWAKKQASGLATIKLSTLQSSDKITLDAGMLTILSIELANGTPLKFEYDGGDKDDGLQINLNRVYKANEDLVLKIRYQTNQVNETDPNSIGGSFGKGLRFFQPSATEPNRRKQIWTSGEPESNRYWFPCNDVPDDLRTTEMSITVDGPLMAITNGDLQKVTSNKNGSKTYLYKAAQAYPNYLTSFVVGEYVQLKQQYKEIKLNTFCYADEKEAAQATIVRLPDMMKFFSEKTGLQYPYKQYSQVMVQEYPFPGMVGQHTGSIISENMIDDYGTHADFLYLWDGVEAHALASQWFGNLVSIKDWRDAWLNQSFAHYFDGLYNSYKNGKDEFLLYYLNFDLSSTLFDWTSAYRRPIVTEKYADVGVYSSDNYTIRRGAMVLRMLQKELGEEKWWKGLKNYIKTFAGRQVTTKDFQNVMETAAGRSLDWFFKQWIYQMGHPVFKIDKIYNASDKKLTLHIRQVQTKDSATEYPQTTFFRGKMDIEIDGKVQAVELEPKEDNKFIFSLASEPKLVHIDYESVWIKEVDFEKSMQELCYQVEHEKDILGKQWALNELVAIAKKEETTAETKEIICSAIRKAILSNVYWRFKLNSLPRLRSLLKPPYDDATINMLKEIIAKEKSWAKASAIAFLGFTNDKRYEEIYIKALSDSSDRVVNAAAVALGKTKSEKAFEILLRLKDKPSWKNQSLISAINGFKELGDQRAVPLLLQSLMDSKAPHWTLGTSVWDHRLAAAETLVALGRGTDGYPLILSQFRKAMEENNVNDIFYNTMQIATLADPRGQEAFDLLKVKFKTDENAMIAVNQYEEQFKAAIKK